MNKRDFIITLGKSTLALAGSNWWLSACENYDGSGENSKNWVWLHPGSGISRGQWKSKLVKVKEAGFDAILLNVYNSTHAFYDTDRLPVKEDVVSKVIPVCRELGLEFHAWMWSMPCNIQYIIQNHPDWYAVNGLNESASEKPAYVGYYKFLCPAHPGVQEFIRLNVKSLAEISEIDGIHFDYIRMPDVILAEALQPKYDIVQDKEYPQYDYCYSDHCRKLFKEQSGIDPLTDLDDPSQNLAWRKFRYDLISNLVNNIMIPETRDKYASAAVFPNWESVRQQWSNWKLDAFFPMLYHKFYKEDIEWIKSQTAKGIESINDRVPIYTGLYVPDLDPPQIQKAITAAIKGGAGGVSLFNLDAITDEHWKSIKMALKSQ